LHINTGCGDIYLLAQLQEPHHLQRLFDIGNLLAQTLGPALGVHLHELVLGDHLLEGAEGRLDFLAGGDVVADIVDEGGDGDPARVGLCCYRAGLEGLVFWFFECGHGIEVGAWKLEGRGFEQNKNWEFTSSLSLPWSRCVKREERKI
jgi:hypothetical protein